MLTTFSNFVPVLIKIGISSESSAGKWLSTWVEYEALFSLNYEKMMEQNMSSAAVMNGLKRVMV